MTTVLNTSPVKSLSTFDDFSFTPLAERITEFKDDPLVLACSLKELVSKNNHYDLESVRVLENVTDSIRNHAEQIRDYYKKKFFWTALADARSLSPFRSRLLNLLENRISSCTDKDCGIYYKLPWFYEEDTIYDVFKKTLKVNEISSLGSSRHKKFTKSLEFLNTSFSWQSKRKLIRYWFKDDNDYLYGLELDKDNPLLTIFDDYVKSAKTVSFQTNLTENRIDSLYYYRMFDYKFIKE